MNPTTRKRKHSGATCTPDARIRRLIERWRKEASGRYVTGHEKNSLRRCADELEKALGHAENHSSSRKR